MDTLRDSLHARSIKCFDARASTLVYSRSVLILKSSATILPAIARKSKTQGHNRTPFDAFVKAYDGNNCPVQPLYGRVVSK